MEPEEVRFFLTQGIVFKKLIAKGGYGVVFLVYSTQYQNNYALKKIPGNLFNQSELDCLIAIDDPAIVSLYQYYQYGKFVYLLMEYCPLDLSTIIKSTKKIQAVERLRYIHDMVLSIKACHERNIAHSDIKPSNFFIDQYGRVKVGDFGFSSMYKDNASSMHFRGTRLFMAPELFYSHPYNPLAADIWALGVTIYLLSTGKYPFYSNDSDGLVRLITIGFYSTKEIDDKNLQDLIARCLITNPASRATVTELLLHPYFDQFNIPAPKKSGPIPMSKSMRAINSNNLIPGVPTAKSFFGLAVIRNKANNNTGVKPVNSSVTFAVNVP